MKPPQLLDPEIAAGIASSGWVNADYNSESLPQLRERQRLAPPPVLSGGVRVTEHLTDSSPPVRLRVHRPLGVPGLLPCIYGIHSGGYVGGGYESFDDCFDQLCQQLRCVGVAVEYRLAPEYPYPAPLEDCYTGLVWLHTHAAELQIDPARVGLYGVSAGGGLAAGLSQLARDRHDEQLCLFQLLLYPMLDDRQLTLSSQWDVPVWSRASNEFGWRSYLGNLYGSYLVPPYAAPARATNLLELPPTLAMVGSLDGFHDEVVNFACRLTQAGVPTELHVFAGAPHGWDVLAPSSSASSRARDLMASWLAARLDVEPNA